VAELLSLSACIEAIEPAFIAHDEGRTLGPAILGVPAGDEGAFHIKAAGVTLGHRYFAAKLNGNFSRNPQQRGRSSRFLNVGAPGLGDLAVE
jgi:ornithine cyclodeaminase/alanine dehydrogenase-like protein (mu-crystallin family)